MSDATKAVAYALIGPNSNEAAVSKAVMYVLLEPGGDSGVSAGQAQVYGQKVNRGD